jgi:hypothetical protein
MNCYEEANVEAQRSAQAQNMAKLLKWVRAQQGGPVLWRAYLEAAAARGLAGEDEAVFAEALRAGLRTH